MQEMLLFGQVPNAHQPTVRQQLSGIARMQPQPAVQRHVLFRPIQTTIHTLPPPKAGASNSQQQEAQKLRLLLNAPLSYIQLVGVPPNKNTSLVDEGQKSVSKTIPTSSTEQTQDQAPGLVWTIEFRDIPEAGKAATSLRGMSRTRLQEGDPFDMLHKLGYQYHSQYVLAGDNFYDQDTTLFLHQALAFPPQSQPPAQNQNQNITFASVNTVPDVSKLTPVDPAGGYILQASIEIADAGSSELKDRATQQLLAMKEILRPSVLLDPGDRLALDTRVSVRRVATAG